MRYRKGTKRSNIVKGHRTSEIKRRKRDVALDKLQHTSLVGPNISSPYKNAEVSTSNEDDLKTSESRFEELPELVIEYESPPPESDPGLDLLSGNIIIDIRHFLVACRNLERHKKKAVFEMSNQDVEAGHSTDASNNDKNTPEEEDEEDNMECECAEKMTSFFQNVLFIVLVIPVTLMVLADIVGSLITCCCFCRGEKKFATKTLYLSYNVGCCSALCLRFLRRTSKEHDEKKDEPNDETSALKDNVHQHI